MAEASHNGVRSPYQVTFSVWKALFLREAVQRLFNRRFAALWLLLQPVASVAFFVFIFTVIRFRVISGIDTALWLMAGLLTFTGFNRIATQSMNAVSANKTLFAYRQVKPVDTVVIRAALESFLAVVIGVVVFLGAAMLGVEVIPDNFLLVLEAIVGLGLFAVGFGLVMSVFIELVPEVANLLSIIMMPLGIISGTIFPIYLIPRDYREWLMLNPIVHALESVRQGFSSYYHVIPETNINYLHGCALVSIFLGLLLHTRFQTRLITQ